MSVYDPRPRLRTPASFVNRDHAPFWSSVFLRLAVPFLLVWTVEKGLTPTTVSQQYSIVYPFVLLYRLVGTRYDKIYTSFRIIRYPHANVRNNHRHVMHDLFISNTGHSNDMMRDPCPCLSPSPGSRSILPSSP
jgi:hypothetical protein